MTTTTFKIVGFDLGHAESAVCVTGADSSVQPEPIELSGAERDRQLLTVVGINRDGLTVVGQEASTARDLVEFHVGFKSPDLDDPAVAEPLRLFVRALVDDALRRGHIPADGSARWVVGAPSGWTEVVRQQYAELLESAGLTNVEVTPESRGALLYARDSDEVQLRDGQIDGDVLMCDLGSSTTDYTRVKDLAPKPVDFGNVRLGAGLIDLEIMRRQLETDIPPNIKQVLSTIPAEHRRFELICRRAKEAFFNASPETVNNPGYEAGVSARIYDQNDRAATVDVYLRKADMDAVLDAPQTVLGGMSWRAAFRRDLVNALGAFGSTPDLLLLTGGPSRMSFVAEICRELVGADRVALGRAPHLAIARGLAIAGRARIKAAGFREDVQRMMHTDPVTKIVDERLPELARQIGAAASAGMTEKYVIPAFLDWRSGKIVTLNDMAARIVGEVNGRLTAGSPSLLERVVGEWQNDVQRRIELKTEPICRRWNVPADAMTLPPVTLDAGHVDVKVDTNVATKAMASVGTVVAVVVSGIVATTLFGAGTALIATTGPFAVLIAFVAAMVGFAVGGDELRKKMMNANIRPIARKLGGAEGMARTLRKKAAESEAQQAASMAEAILSKSKDDLRKEIVFRVTQQLEERAERAELLIT